MPQSILKQHAIENIWCEPRQDRHYVIEPERLTKNGGAFRYMMLLNERLDLPAINNNITRNFFHVYQIGKLNDAMFNLDLADNVWYNVNELCEFQAAKVDVYLPNGAFVLRSDVYLRNNKDNNFIVAIRINSKINYGKEKVINRVTGALEEINISLDNHKPILRFHKSAWFTSSEFRGLAPNVNYPIRSRISTILNQAGFIAFRELTNNIAAAYGSFGRATWYQEGFVVSAPTTYALTMANTTFTYIWDSGIISRSMIPISDCPTFVSKLDQFTKKYLVILPDKYNTIHYHDDLDFHLIRRETNGSYKGVYINRLSESAIRMVSHNAYAIKADIISSLMSANSALFNDLSKIFIMVTVRHGGMNKGLVTQATRIEDLYRLDRSQIIQAMTGVNSTLPEWRAEYLENSAYAKVMRSLYENLTDELAEDAYGYNSATKVAANPLHMVKYSGAQGSIDTVAGLNIPQPWNSQLLRHYFLYDKDGLLVDQRNATAFSNIEMMPPGVNFKYAEMYIGQIREGTDDIIYNSNYEHHELAYYGFRCYVSPMVDGVPTDDWEDVTGTKYYTYTDDPIPKIVWNFTLLNNANFYPAIKISRGSVVFKHNLTAASYPGYISFRVTHQINGVDTDIKIAPGQVDVFMNGESLNKDIDYYMDWPAITIVRRPINVDNINIVVRLRGFCNPKTMKPFEPRDNGFVYGGILSVDDEYDVQADRNIRIVVNGKLKARDEVTFAENATNPIKQIDGRAWSVTDHQVTVEHFTGKKTIDFLMTSLDLDERVKAYLTPRIKIEKPENPYIQGEPWALVSPFISAIIHGFTKYNFLSDKDLTETFVAEEVNQWIQPYKTLLDFDPCLDEEIDSWYIKIYPHIYSNMIEVTDGQYRFLEYVIRNYLNNRIDLTPSVIIRRV
jgi:hypothetical protein